MEIFLTIYFICFAIIAWHRYVLSLAIFLFLLPTYLIRFEIFGLPTTLLEGMLAILFLIWLFRQNKKFSTIKNQFLTWGIVLFLLGATINIFTATDLLPALGQWKAFYIEPILLSVIILTSIKEKKDWNTLLYGLVASGLATGLLATYQHFTGWMVPWDFWQNRNTFRVTGWYGFPNGVGIYLAPIIFVAASLFKKTKHISARLSLILMIVLGLASIIFAKSTGALIGVLAGVGVLLLMYKKTRWPTVALAVAGLIILTLLPTNNPIRQELFFQDRSGQIRLSMWAESTKMLNDQPLFGAGLASYKKVIEPYHTTVNGEGIEIFHHPHNQFLTFWSELGITGLIGFLLILVALARTKNIEEKKYIFAALTVFLIMSLVDSPYIKNDMAIMFWVFASVLVKKSK
jgi:O-antigen ligase